MLISPQDIAELTGYSRPTDQIRWLLTHGWVFEVGGDRRPKVLRAYAERRMGAGAVESKAREPQLRLSAHP